MLLTLIFAALALQSPPSTDQSEATPVPTGPVSGIILSDDPDPPVQAVVQRPLPDLPASALADPFGWERAQCSPYLRKEESLEVCQVRVRSDLYAVLGERLPEALRPTAGLENCTPGNAKNGFKVECRPRELSVPASPHLDDRHCENVPERGPDGQVIIQTRCRSTGPETRPEGLSLKVFGRD